MTPDVVAELRKEEQSELHTALLRHGLAQMKLSRSVMSKYYTDWDMQNSVFKGERYLDEDDIKQARREKPVKMVVPNTFAQVMTFSSFVFLLFNQNKTFYELLPSGNEDYGDKQQDCERILERDCRANQWNKLIFQHLLDVGRFGPAIIDTCWTKMLAHAYVTPEPTVVNYQGVVAEVRPGSGWQDFVKFEGNLVRAVSPYRWFPDTRFPLSEFHRGAFCGFEEEYSMTSLRDLESVGEVAGVDRIQGLPRGWKSARGGETRTVMQLNKDENFLVGPSSNNDEGTAIVSKLQTKIVPAKFTYGDGKKLGPEEFPIMYHLWYANDNRVIRAEPTYAWHNEFSCSLSQFTPDMHQTLSYGLADLIYRLQDVISWHINARITDVRRNMRGRLIVDPNGVETSTLDSEGDIYLRKSAGKAGIDRWIKQLQMVDTTSGHLQDADILGKIMEVVTGINSNAMGQYNTGRRSSLEARNVMAGASGRMKMHAHLIWEGGVGPTGKKMLSNSRQTLSFDAFKQAIGATVDPARYTAFRGTPAEVIGGGDYFTFDSTMASEKGFIAQALQELLVAIISNPIAAQQLDLDPRLMMDEVQYLRGAGSMRRFSLSQGQAAGKPVLPIVANPPPPKVVTQ